ncbi:hypothetical protein KAX17_18450 [Candidatus Bipolaricaulota bacterium]|nr:hypothetical protein [Candidatus Bipolaricaulota bacterium]
MANWPDELRDVVDEIQAALGPEDKLILFREITYGFSKSRVFLVDIESGKHDYSGMAILKVTQGNMPDGMAFESRKLQQALEGSPEGFAERHLPRLVFCHKSEKFSAVFTSVVSGSLESVEPLIKLGAKQLTAALFSISKKLLDEWNPDYSWREDSTPLWDTLPAWLEKKSDRLLNGVGEGDLQIEPAYEAFSLDGEWMPNPLWFLANGGGALADYETRMAVGRLHGDLHGYNVLIRMAAPHQQVNRPGIAGEFKA